MAIFNNQSKSTSSYTNAAKNHASADAIQFDAVSTTGLVGSGFPVTLSHTCSGGDNRLLVMAIDVFTGATNDITSVTYGGVAMTEAVEREWEGNGFMVFYTLANPSSGTNDVVVSVTGPGELYEGVVTALSYTGCKQAVPEASNETGGTGTALSTSVTTVTDYDWLVALWVLPSAIGVTLTDGSNYTTRASDGLGMKRYVGDSNGSVGTAGLKSQTASINISREWDVIQIAIAPASAASEWGNQNKSTYTTGYFLRETGDRILQESNFGILLESGGSVASQWSNLVKS